MTLTKIFTYKLIKKHVNKSICLSNYYLSTINNSFLIFCKFTKNNIFINIQNKNNKSILTYSLGTLSKQNKKDIQGYFWDYIIKFLKKNSISEFNIIFNKGSYNLRKNLLCNLFKHNLFIKKLSDSTKVKYNGCKLKKKTRGNK